MRNYTTSPNDESKSECDHSLPSNGTWESIPKGTERHARSEAEGVSRNISTCLNMIDIQYRV